MTLICFVYVMLRPAPHQHIKTAWEYCFRSFLVRRLAITDINYCNLLIYKTKSPLVKKAGNNSVTKRQFYRL